MQKIIFATLLAIISLAARPASVQAAQIVPAATTPNGQYTIVLDNNPAYSGPVDIKSWVCDNRNPTACTSPSEARPWRDANGQPYLFSNNRLVINLAGLNIPENIYHLQVATTPGNYGSDMQVNVTRNALANNPPHNSATLTTLTQNAISSYLQTYPLLDLPGANGQTINQIYNNSALNPEQKTLGAIQVTCGAQPNPLSAQDETMASWRLCAAAFSYVLMSYHAYTNSNAMVAPYAYMIAFQLDSLISSSTNPPLHGNLGNQFQLDNTDATQSYINDAGMGIQSGLAWLKARNLIAQSYCTALETPFDPGRNCKTIDLSWRISHVAQRVIDGTSESWRPDLAYRARSAAGRAVAAVVVGDPSQLATLKQRAIDLVSTELGTNPGITSPVPYASFGWSDYYQHMLTVFNVNNWVVPPAFQNHYLVWTRVFFGSYLDKTFPIADLANNTYIEANIRAAFPPAIVSLCGTPGGDFHRTTGNRVVGLRGEPLSDAITTSTPPLYFLLSSINQLGLAQEVADITARSLNRIIATPAPQSEEMCDPGDAFGEPKNPLSVGLRTFGYLYYTVVGFAHSPYQSFNDPPLYKGDLNDDGRINGQDLRLLIPNWLSSTNDLNSDSKVNAFDAALVISNFGR